MGGGGGGRTRAGGGGGGGGGGGIKVEGREWEFDSVDRGAGGADAGVTGEHSINRSSSSISVAGIGSETGRGIVTTGFLDVLFHKPFICSALK